MPPKFSDTTPKIVMPTANVLFWRLAESAEVAWIACEAAIKTERDDSLELGNHAYDNPELKNVTLIVRLGGQKQVFRLRRSDSHTLAEFLWLIADEIAFFLKENGRSSGSVAVNLPRLPPRPEPRSAIPKPAVTPPVDYGMIHRPARPSPSAAPPADLAKERQKHLSRLRALDLALATYAAVQRPPASAVTLAGSSPGSGSGRPTLLVSSNREGRSLTLSLSDAGGISRRSLVFSSVLNLANYQCTCQEAARHFRSWSRVYFLQFQTSLTLDEPETAGANGALKSGVPAAEPALRAELLKLADFISPDGQPQPILAACRDTLRALAEANISGAKDLLAVLRGLVTRPAVAASPQTVKADKTQANVSKAPPVPPKPAEKSTPVATPARQEPRRCQRCNSLFCEHVFQSQTKLAPPPASETTGKNDAKPTPPSQSPVTKGGAVKQHFNLLETGAQGSLFAILEQLHEQSFRVWYGRAYLLQVMIDAVAGKGTTFARQAAIEETARVVRLTAWTVAQIVLMYSRQDAIGRLYTLLDRGQVVDRRVCIKTATKLVEEIGAYLNLNYGPNGQPARVFLPANCLETLQQLDQQLKTAIETKSADPLRVR